MTVIDDTLPNEVFDAYRALFPNERSKAGAQAFPKLVPINTEMDGTETAKQAVT